MLPPRGSSSMGFSNSNSSSNSWVYYITAGLASLPEETLHHIITCKEWEALEHGEIGEKEAVQRIAASLTLPPEHEYKLMTLFYQSAVFNLGISPQATELGSHVLRGKAWLRANARHLLNQIESSEIFEDTFSQFLIMEATNDTSLLHLHPYEDAETNSDIRNTTNLAKQWNYFLGKPVGTTMTFPADVDSTSYALLAFTPTLAVNDILDSMLANRNHDGLVQTYWDQTRPRVDICVLTNVTRTFYKYNRSADIQESLAYVGKALNAGTYMSGTRHYCTAEVFFFFLSQLIADHPYAPEVQLLRVPLAKALAGRMGVYENEVTQAELDLAEASRAKGEKYEAYVPEVDSLAIAYRVLACQSLGLRPQGIEDDIKRLASLQCDDGGWPLGWVCRYGRSKLRIGSRGVVTAYAIKALGTEAKMSAQIVDVVQPDIYQYLNEHHGMPIAGSGSA
ncbi:hypothetical protein P171DRAFT_517532 [Karstenula rhodostoma CBS 690.94]|uniref:Uncharacterized protein n=1 Tax=Karstenula rhodostoma CBS 690.94 TaxID=1392251 RepID=A0A9P4PV76_9PLEO|nr:hypothetical protein P171DRAFT_517532 [Karstenula rhodostoma CBS 690.94]